MSHAAPAPEALEQAILASPDDLEARYRLGAARLMHDDYDGALAQLLEVARRDPLFCDAAGRAEQIFSVTGSGSADGAPLDYICRD